MVGLIFLTSKWSRRLIAAAEHRRTHEKMKKNISLLFIVILALSPASCTDKDESRELVEAKIQYMSENIKKNGSDEFISLLSIKYNLNIDLTHKIINEFKEDLLQKYSPYKAKTLEEFEKGKKRLDKPSVEERIKKISTEHNVEQSKIASLLIDYKIWYEAYDH